MVDSCTCTVWPVIYTAVKLIMAMPPMAVWLVVQCITTAAKATTRPRTISSYEGSIVIPTE